MFRPEDRMSIILLSESVDIVIPLYVRKARVPERKERRGLKNTGI